MKNTQQIVDSLTDADKKKKYLITKEKNTYFMNNTFEIEFLYVCYIYSHWNKIY